MLAERLQHVINHRPLPLRSPNSQAQARKLLQASQAGHNTPHSVVSAVPALLPESQSSHVDIEIVVKYEQTRRRHLVELEKWHHGIATVVHERLRLDQDYRLAADSAASNKRT
jgi:hypothetical protein